MSNLTLDQALNAALEHHQAGRLSDAEAFYRQILAQFPEHADALHLLGVVAHQTGHHDAAIELISKAISVNPQNPPYFSNIGLAFAAKGQLDQALAAYQRAVSLNSGFGEAWDNMGICLTAMGRHGEAAGAHARSTALLPNAVQMQQNFAMALSRIGRLEESLAAIRRAVALVPAAAGLHNSEACILHAMGRREEAMESYRKCVELDGSNIEGRTNLALVLNELGRAEESVKACKEALELAPTFYPIWNNLGNAFQELNKLEESVDAYKKAIESNAQCAEAYNNMGTALARLGRLNESLASMQKAREINPRFLDVLNNIGNIQKEMGNLDDAIKTYREALAIAPGAVCHSNLILALYYHTIDGEEVLRESRKWDELYAKPLRDPRPHGNSKDPERKLKIGYVSSDLRLHPVGRFLHPAMVYRDREKFDITCYSAVRDPDSYTDRLKGDSDHWVNIVGKNEDQIAEMVRNDQIDILIDLTMHTAGNRLLTFARKPAPIQMTYLAYVGTTGLEAIDYRFTDPYLEPEGQPDPWASEKTLWLPSTYWCYEAPEMDLPIKALPAEGNGYVTFACLNNFCKLNLPVIRLWAEILNRVPNSRILFHAREGDHRTWLLSELGACGVAADRVMFMGYVKVEEYLRKYYEVDIALDPFPYNGGTTTCDALWMGVPTVVLKGERGMARAGYSILSNGAMSELLAQTAEQYVDISVALAGDLGKLAEFRRTARGRLEGSRLMDGRDFARGMEAGFRKVWREYCAK
jgi:predicted O-linked N-acetylglucosamine transferase (SPINDLY family)